MLFRTLKLYKVTSYNNYHRRYLFPLLFLCYQSNRSSFFQNHVLITGLALGIRTELSVTNLAPQMGPESSLHSSFLGQASSSNPLPCLRMQGAGEIVERQLLESWETGKFASVKLEEPFLWVKEGTEGWPQQLLKLLLNSAFSPWMVHCCSILDHFEKKEIECNQVATPLAIW